MILNNLSLKCLEIDPVEGIVRYVADSAKEDEFEVMFGEQKAATK
jgi:hypothetical protein